MQHALEYVATVVRAEWLRHRDDGSATGENQAALEPAADLLGLLQSPGDRLDGHVASHAVYCLGRLLSQHGRVLRGT